MLLLGDLMASATWLANQSLLISYIFPNGTRGFWAHIFEKMVVIQICTCHAEIVVYKLLEQISSYCCLCLWWYVCIV